MGEVLFTVATLKAKPINTGKREGRSPNSLNSENWNILLLFFFFFFQAGHTNTCTYSSFDTRG